jgi:hypothetical protein
MVDERLKKKVVVRTDSLQQSRAREGALRNRLEETRTKYSDIATFHV